MFQARYSGAVNESYDLPCPRVDLTAAADPLHAIMSEPAFTEMATYFAAIPASQRSLISAVSEALLYSLVRNLRPANVIEIGTYRAGTAEVICRALAANGRGTLYTTDPYCAPQIEPILEQWPAALRRHLQFSAMNSAEFFSEVVERLKIRSAMTFVDGNHDYEFALFDILSAARTLEPGGFLIIDNVSQSGPYFAARDFLDGHPDWLECRVNDHAPDLTKAFDPERSNIDGTDFIVLRAPSHVAAVTDRPVSFGLLVLDSTGCNGITVALGDVACEGTLHAQCVLRGFSSTRENVEVSSSASEDVSPRDSGAPLDLPAAIDVGPGFDAVRLEIWLTWTGPTPLLLTEAPAPFFGRPAAVRSRPVAVIEPDPEVGATSPSTPVIEPAIYSDRQAKFTNRMEPYAAVFEGVVPWTGTVPRGFLVDFSGTLTDARFRTMWGVDPETAGGRVATTGLPTIEDGEGWFEAVNWVLAAREARDHFVMMTLGACYGAQAVGSYRMLQQLNPMPCTLVAVEPVPENYEWMVRHFRDNGIDPDSHWLMPHVVADSNEPVLFPVGAPGTGAGNAIATNDKSVREHYLDLFTREGPEPAIMALRNLLLHNTTGITRELLPGSGLTGEIKFVSAVTLRDLLGPFDLVDYIESDIQQSEIIVFPPFIDLLRRKVRRIHIGTHGKETHWSLHDLFADHGWEIVFSFEPNAWHETTLGNFETNDGVLTVRNPSL